MLVEGVVMGGFIALRSYQTTGLRGVYIPLPENNWTGTWQPFG